MAKTKAKSDNKPEVVQADAKETEKDKDDDKKNQITLLVIVGGHETQVTANVNAPLHTIIPKALEATGNVVQPERWELKLGDTNGTLLDPNKKIGEFGFTGATKLFLSLKAGAAGA